MEFTVGQTVFVLDLDLGYEAECEIKEKKISEVQESTGTIYVGGYAIIERQIEYKVFATREEAETHAILRINAHIRKLEKIRKKLEG